MTVREKLEKLSAQVSGGVGSSGITGYETFDLLKESDFAEMVERKIAADKVKKEAEAELELVKGEIEAYMAAVDQTKVGFGRLVVERRSGTTASAISATKLLEQGVSVDQIAEATTPGRQYTFIQITDPQGAAEARAAKKTGGKG